MDDLKTNDNMESESNRDIVCFLWRQRDHLCHALKEWELDLSDLGVDRAAIKQGLKVRLVIE